MTEATLRQIAAADPGRSTWVSANAGSGKTRVLTDRVARLLLGGTDPARILCLTYTKAAAAEMQNRLFKGLGGWAMLPDEALRTALRELGAAGPLDADRLAGARRLFAQAVEVPGGLRILTIHAFCAALLRRFPLEAGVSPAFAEMDDRAARLLRDEVLDALAGGIAPAAVEGVAGLAGGDLAAFAAEVAGKRTGFAAPLDAARARALFGVEGDEAGLAGWVLPEGDLLAAVAGVMAGGKDTDLKNAAKLLRIDPEAPDLEVLEEVCLFTAKAANPHVPKIGTVPTKDIRARMGALLDPWNDLMQRVAEARPRRIALQAAGRTAAVHAFAAAFLPEYERRKAARGLLDFDDLILRARGLLTDPAIAPWVLWRLDGAIDHILVDEAQDTSPLQWQVIEALAAEFTAGAGARSDPRTLFVVGDRKQSIYSFQGADVAVFAERQERFGAAFDAAGAPMQLAALEHSFRTGPALLRLVDQVFQPPAVLDGSVHRAFREELPGRAELWPLIEPAPEPDPGEWSDPVDLLGSEHHSVRLGRAVAARLREVLDRGEAIPTPKGDRALTPGDVLILVRRRSEVFHNIIRECKRAGLPIAGSDRLRLGGEIAARDIAAVLNLLALPQDDLSLAAALRSPLFGWSEDKLYRLAQGREGTLWAALQRAGDSPALAVLTDLRNQADFLRPYELIDRLLTRHDGRRRLVGRLGAEAEDGIDEVLTQALAYEQQAVPSLTGFLTWLDADRIEVKRQPDAAGDRIRVMTVHGAKGLEAPLVILPDTAAYTPPVRDKLVMLGGVPVWRGARDDDTPEVAAAKADQAERDAAESLRLLYVALTRAQSWLIVAAAGKLKDEGGDGLPAWYQLVREGMRRAGGVETPEGGLTLTDAHWPAPQFREAQAEAEVQPLPLWVETPAPAVARVAAMLSPSALGGAKALAGDGLAEEVAMALGSGLHRLLEHLPLYPPQDWPALAPLLVEGEAGALLAEAAGVLRHPAFAPLFAPGTLAEVPVVGDWNGRRVGGVIDRLVIGPTGVLAVDYKSNRVLPRGAEDVPEGLLRQMGAYAHLLRQVFPGRAIRTAILWTRGPLLTELPPALTAAALDRAGAELPSSPPSLDLSRAGSYLGPTHSEQEI